ncbi:deoxycytidylate deaminase [Sphingomonas sp. ACRSK]|uniref:deoxycytidylate deaminase n=1 Tax=Sphingomonas sp. ACRSK TaxID=2918213 RepID=UPI00406C89CF
MSWVERWMQIARVYAGWSKDPRRGVGAVIVNDRQVQVSGGWNGAPRGVADLPERYSPSLKSSYVEHAEANAIANAASEGIATRGCTIYSTYFPCSSCARAIIQAGIGIVVSPEPDMNYTARSDDWRISLEMFREAGLKVTWENEAS